MDFLTEHEHDLTAILSYVSLSPRSFAVVGILGRRRWQIDLAWTSSNWVVFSRKPHNDGYFLATGYPSSLAASCTGFLGRLYHPHFLHGYIYAIIETKNVGVDLFHRIIYDLGEHSFEAVVQSTFAVEYSHVLVSWNPVIYLKHA